MASFGKGWYTRLPWRSYLVGSLAAFTLIVLGLFLMGQPFFSKTGLVTFWHGMTQSADASQQFSDWYTFSHVIHGFAFYVLLWWIGKRYNWPVGLRLFFALILEGSWELWENTDFAINRYRESTISLNYFGDSILNSIGDMVAMVAGFVIAWRAPVWFSVFCVVLLELLALCAIRDNLTLNIIMFIYPIKAILSWQAAGKIL